VVCCFPSQKSHFLPRTSSVVSVVLSVGMCFLALATVAWPQQQSTEQTQPARPIHIVPRTVGLNVLGRGASSSHAPGIQLNYYGGPVVSNLRVVVVFWGTRVSSVVTDGIGGFFQNITNSIYFDLLSEYSTNVTPIGGGAGTNQSIGRGTYGGSYTITPSVCNGGVPPCLVTDAQVQTEVINQINAAQLPMPELDSNGNVDTLYMIYFPSGVTIQLQTFSSCVYFCAYHGTTTGTFNSKNLAYGVMPDFGPTSGCARGCGTGTELQNVTLISSHEMAETVTDFDAELAALYFPPLAWIDPIFGTGEIGDICNHQESVATTPGGTYTVQLLWSNQRNACVNIGSHPSFQLTAPSTVMPGASFNFTVAAVNPVGSSTDTSFAGSVHFTSSDPQAVLPADFTFTPNDQGTQDFGATLKKSGAQTITATDTVNSAILGTATVTVGGTTLTFIPTSLLYGIQAIGTTSFARKVTLTNQTGGTISIASIAITGTNASDFLNTTTTCSSTLAVNQSCIVNVTFTPGALGPRSATLLITDDAGNSPQQVTLSGTGVPQVSVAPAAVTFAATFVGSTGATRLIRVKNNLRTTLTFAGTPFTFTGTDPGDFAQSATTCGTTLAAGTACTVSVTFIPTGQGVRTAVLNVADSASPSPQTANLAGTGK
jgi:hypothetical protein